jgi:aminoglycoside phosphotransferase (APT) family kinase protein
MFTSDLRSPITSEEAVVIVGQQFPEWSDLPIEPVKQQGWDNTTFRLGSSLTARFPSADMYAPQVAKEHRWLPVLAKELPLAIPQPVALGKPTNTFPRPWSVNRWIEGTPASDLFELDQGPVANALAEFLRELRGIDSTGGPLSGAHNFYRGGPLRMYDEETRSALEVAEEWVDKAACWELWQEALATQWSDLPVWVHGDVSASNLLLVDGMLSAVIDFGCMAIGDPACDLVIAWMFFRGPAREIFRDGMQLDRHTWARGRGWALWKALTLLATTAKGADASDLDSAVANWAHGVIDEVLADQQLGGS